MEDSHGDSGREARLRAKVLGVIVGKDKLADKEGAEKLFEFLDTLFGKDKFVDMYDIYKKKWRTADVSST